MSIRPIKYFTVTPDYPSEPYGLYVSKRINPLLDDFSHFIVLDGDMAVEDDFWCLPAKLPNADIITVQVVPNSRIYFWWEKLTYWIRIDPRDRVHLCLACCFLGLSVLSDIEKEKKSDGMP